MKIKHLEFIQAVISRMANTSAVLKGWTITLATGLFALATKNNESDYIILSYFLILIFWFLDGYFLMQERAYRKLFDEVRLKGNDQIDFSMDIRKYCDSRWLWLNTTFSKILNVFYLAIIILIVALTYILSK